MGEMGMAEKKGICFINIFTILLFCCAITAPLLLFHHEEGRVAILDNKAAAVRPKLSDYNIFDGKLPEDLDEYFSDNIGLRDEAIKANVYAKYRWFDKIDIPNYLLGKEGHLFNIAGPGINNMRTYQGVNLISEDKEQELMQQLVDLDTAIRERGSEFIYMPIPNKEQIYGAFVPGNIHVLSNDNMMRSLTANLLSNTSLHVVDTEQALLNHKEDGELLYYRTVDPLHWNHYGAFCGYMALMEKIHEIDPSVTYLTLEDVVVSHEETTPFSNLTGRLDTFSDMSDLNYTVTPISGWHCRPEFEQPAGFSLTGDMSGCFYHFINPQAASGKSLLVWGDSYIQTFMLPYLGESFSDVYFLYNLTASEEILTELCHYVKTDFILYEYVARVVDYGDKVKPLNSAVTQAWYSGPTAEVCASFSNELTPGEYQVFWAENCQFTMDAMKKSGIGGGQTEVRFEIPVEGWNTLRLDLIQGMAAIYDITSLTLDGKRCVIDGGGDVEITETDTGWRIQAGVTDPFVTFHVEM